MKLDNFYKKKLKNGLTVLFEKRELGVVACSVSAKFGAEYENAEFKGISHFIEHLVFKGTKNRTQQQISSEIENKGGILNAFTGEEFTTFWNKLPSKHFGVGIEIVSDLVLNPLFDKFKLEQERKVILEEIKMYHDNPQLYVMDKIKELLYTPPFGLSIAGTNATMSKMKRRDVLNVFNSAYSPGNMILAIVGNADFEEICEAAEEKFPEKKSFARRIVPFKKNGMLIEKRKDIDQANLVFGFHVPSLKDRGRYAAEIVNCILTQGMSSRLFQEIREKRGLAYAVRGILDADRNYGYQAIYAGTTKDKVQRVKEIILREIKKLQNLGKKELDEAKEQLIGLRKVSSEDSQQVMTELILEENAGNAEEYYNYEEKITSARLQDIKEIIKLKGYSFTALVPE